MVGHLLLRGMLVGFLASVLSFAFLKVAGEPSVDRAIAFEAQLDGTKTQAAPHEAKGMPMQMEVGGEAIVSRGTQAGLGLFTGVSVYCVAFGGLFALVFALAYGRMGRFDARMTSALVALMGFVAVYLVPSLKYPANPPSVGDPDTLGLRTALYFGVIAMSLVAVVAASKLHALLVRRLGGWNATIVAAGFYALIVLGAGLLLPAVDEVPDAFPAVVLWQFRLASLGAQAIMWATIGLGFGIAAERLFAAGKVSTGTAIRV